MALRDRRIDDFFEIWWLQEVGTFEFHQAVFKEVAMAGVNSL